MKNIKLTILLAITFVFTNCNFTNDKKITDANDYSLYLNVDENKALTNAKEELIFWENKLEETPNQYPYLSKIASANSSLFKLSGNISQLKSAEENLLSLNKKTNYNNTNYLRSLARNYISQHRFKEALELLTKAEYIGENLSTTQLMLVDVYLELGNIEKVEKYLSKVKNLKDFDYLIRLSKYNDHLGNLDNAIKYLENALTFVKYSRKDALVEWSYTNLGDYYGHAGRIKDSYNSYLNALEINPNNSYAKKGIAWIVYSHEKNPEEAIRILDNVLKENQSPDYYLLKAEIADFMGNSLEKEKNTNLYLEKVADKNYGAMYAKYNVLLFAEKEKNIKALEIAKQEVEDRPTAQSYHLLAWAYYKTGNIDKALEITQNKVVGKTFEPEALLHAAQILKAHNETKKVKELKKELLGAIYELGPSSEQEIKNL